MGSIRISAIMDLEFLNCQLERIYKLRFSHNICITDTNIAAADSKFKACGLIKAGLCYIGKL